MAINKKLIHFNEKSEFEKRLANGEILDTSIVFIKDSKEIWTHGNYYASTPILRSSGTSSVLQEVEVSSFVDENPDAPTSGQDIPTVASGNYSVVLNGKSNASAKRSLAHGNRTIAQGENSHTEGHCTQTVNIDDVTNGYAAHAEGYGSMAGGTYSHAEGNRTKTAAPNSHAEGYLSITTPEAESSHAEGYETSAEAPASHTEGNNTKTHKAYSHAEGRQTETFGEASHTEGNETFTEGDYAHAEGWMTRAKGAYSHAEGQYTFTYADAAHSEGNNTHAHAPFSHAEGLGTKTNPDIIGQHVEGYYNADSDGVKVIGCGTADDARMNAVEVKQDGRVFVKGLGNFDGTNSNEAADMAHVVNNKANSGDVYNKTEMDNRIKADLVQKVEVATINGQSLIRGGNVNVNVNWNARYALEGFVKNRTHFLRHTGSVSSSAWNFDNSKEQRIATVNLAANTIYRFEIDNDSYYITTENTKDVNRLIWSDSIVGDIYYKCVNGQHLLQILRYRDFDTPPLELQMAPFSETKKPRSSILKQLPDIFISNNIARKQELTELSEKVNKKQNAITDLTTIRSGAAKGATALQSVPSEYITEDELTAKSYATTAALNNKVDKIDGKGLSTEDFTTALKNKLNELSNYDDTSVFNAIGDLDRRLNILVEGDVSSAIESFNEITAFLEGVQDTEDMAGIIASIEQQIAGTYSKPSTGIPKTDLASAVQESLGKADTALQSYTEQYQGTVTGVKINGETKNPSSGVVDLGTVITEHQTLKTINGKSIVGNDDIKISDVYITDFTVNDIEALANGLSNNNIQADIAALYEAVSAHKLVLVPYDADEGYHGYGIVSGYMEDLFYITINLEQGRGFDLELDRFSNEIREDQIVGLRQWWDKQDTLVSGTNIKTINDQSVLGNGNVNVGTVTSITPGTGLLNGDGTKDSIKTTGILNLRPASGMVLGGVQPLFSVSKPTSLSGSGAPLSLVSSFGMHTPTVTNIQVGTRNYPVIVDSNGVPFVNVPWSSSTDTKVTNTATTDTVFYVCGSSNSATETGTLYKGSGVKVQSGTQLYASGGFFESSDKTLKDIHGNISVDLEKLSKLSKVYFNFKNDKDTIHIGVIAQEVQELYPEIVSTDVETGKLAVEYDKLSVVALAAIDNLHEENKKLKNKTNDLEERLAKLESLFENQLNKSN